MCSAWDACFTCLVGFEQAAGAAIPVEKAVCLQLFELGRHIGVRHSCSPSASSQCIAQGPQVQGRCELVNTFMYYVEWFLLSIHSMCAGRLSCSASATNQMLML